MRKCNTSKVISELKGKGRCLFVNWKKEMEIMNKEKLKEIYKKANEIQMLIDEELE
jgi:hypothetical protein